MPTKDYDPIRDLIESFGATHTRPVTRVTTDTKGNITIGHGTIHNYDTATFSGPFTMEPVKTKKEPVNPFAIRSVLSNRKKNAFTVVWEDGTTTVVHCQPGDEWDDEKALAMCFTKKALGNKGNFNDKFNDALEIMKTIPTESAPEKACNCDGKRDSGIHSCTKCVCVDEAVVSKTDSLAEAMDKLKESTDNALSKAAKAAEKSSNSLKEMIDALTGETVTVEGKPEPSRVYKVYHIMGSKSNLYNTLYSVKSLRQCVKELATSLYGKVPYYYRTWMNGNRMRIDFGSYTQFIEVEGITPDEYAKN